MAGYSSRTLIDKLGIKEGMRAVFLNAPQGYAAILGRLPQGVTTNTDFTDKHYDFIHLFASRRNNLVKDVHRALMYLDKNGMFWISWPKKASKIPTDLNENVLREICLPLGIVDIKVCAVDDNWSGLKFVFRKENR